MNEIERQIMNDLRESPLSALTKAEFEVLEKAVEANGILNLKGVIRNVLLSAVAKYNDNHDEKGRFSSGSGGGFASPKGDGKGDSNLKPMDYMDRLNSVHPSQLTAQQKMDLARMVRHYVVNPNNRGIVDNHTFRSWQTTYQRDHHTAVAKFNQNHDDRSDLKGK